MIQQEIGGLRIEQVSKTDHAVLRSVYRLRYEVLVEERRDRRYANPSRLFEDEHDRRQKAKILVAKTKDNQCIGTLRLCPRGRTALLGDQCYKWKILADRLLISEKDLLPKIGLIDRVCIQRPFRTQGVFTQLLANAIAISGRIGLGVLVCAIHSSNKAALQSVQRRNFALYDSPQNPSEIFGHLYREI